MKKLVLTLIIGALGIAGAGAQPRVLSLEECSEMALTNNAKVRIAQGNVRAAKEVSREAFTHYFPTVDATALWFRSNKGVLQYTLPSFDIPMLGPLDLGTLSIIKKGWAASLFAVQPVFAGGRIINGNKLAHVGETAANLEQENASKDVRLTTEQYYWKLHTLKSEKQTLQSVLAMVDTLEYQVSVAVNAGIILPNDLLKVQLERNNLQASMVDLDNGIALVSNLLAQHIGLNGQEIDIECEPDADSIPQYPHDIYMEPREALANTADYRLLDAQVDAAKLRSRIAVGDNLPTVGIGAGLFYDDLISQEHHFAAVMVSVNVPLTDWWGGSHKIRQSRIAEENARIQQEDLSQMLCIKMEDSWDNLTSAYRKMQIAKEAIAQATENLRLNENYYRVGVSTITDLLEAQTLYRRSLDQYSEAYGNFRLTRAQYLAATGRL